MLNLALQLIPASTIPAEVLSFPTFQDGFFRGAVVT